MKRFTDSDKWSDKFFRTLSPTGKVFWMWLCDNCDNAGIWERDDDLFQFFAGTSIEVDSLLEEVDSRIDYTEDCVIFLPKFVQFQQGGMLNEAKAPHRQILRILDKHGLEQAECGKIRKGNGRVSKGLAKGNDNLTKGLAKGNLTQSVTLPKVTGLSNSNSKGKGEESEKGGRSPETEIPLDLQQGDFEESWISWLIHLDDLKRARPSGKALSAVFHTFQKWGVERSSAAIQFSISNNWASIHEEKGISSQNQKVKIHESDHDNPFD